MLFQAEPARLQTDFMGRKKYLTMPVFDQNILYDQSFADGNAKTPDTDIRFHPL